jgi:hypothetical protein
VLNKTIYTLVTNCTKADGVRNYFDVGVIGYGGQGVGPGLGEALAGTIIHAITTVANTPLRVEERTKLEDDGAGGAFARASLDDIGALSRSSTCPHRRLDFSGRGVRCVPVSADDGRSSGTGGAQVLPHVYCGLRGRLLWIARKWIETIPIGHPYLGQGLCIEHLIRSDDAV